MVNFDFLCVDYTMRSLRNYVCSRTQIRILYVCDVETTIVTGDHVHLRGCFINNETHYFTTYKHHSVPVQGYINDWSYPFQYWFDLYGHTLKIVYWATQQHKRSYTFYYKNGTVELFDYRL